MSLYNFIKKIQYFYHFSILENALFLRITHTKCITEQLLVSFNVFFGNSDYKIILWRHIKSFNSTNESSRKTIALCIYFIFILITDFLITDRFKFKSKHIKKITSFLNFKINKKTFFLV